MTPYYADDAVTLYLADCREVLDEINAGVVITDPPYGIGWRLHGSGPDGGTARWTRGRSLGPIAGDDDTRLRDEVLTRLATVPAAVFGSFRAAPPAGVRQTLVHHKPRGSGVVGATLGFRRDAEPIWLIGPWPRRAVRWSSVLQSASGFGGPLVHPHEKPIDVLCALIEAAPPGTVLDPFAGSGTTLAAAKLLDRRAIGIEIDERWCEAAARRLAQGVLAFGPTV